MSESVQETVLTSVIDNLADSFFSGGASSNNVITAPDTSKDSQQEQKQTVKNVGITSPLETITADDLIGDILEKPDDVASLVDDDQPHKDEPKQTVEKPDVSDSDYDFLIKEGIIAGYEDDSPIKDKKELADLIKANKEVWVEEAKTNALKEYEETLPEEVKLAIDYAKNGGTDFKSLFKLLSENQEIREYDIEKVEDQRSIIRNYYEAQDWTEDEIDQELVSLVESDKLKQRAAQLKPKLDKVNQDRIQEETARQQYIKEQQQKAREFYVNNVVETLKKGSLGDLKLNKKEQQDVYNALVQESYDSFAGKTNRLGALLDKIQYIEPNYELLAKVTMYLSDPQGFEQKIRDSVQAKVVADTVKKIKIDKDRDRVGSEAPADRAAAKKLPKFRSGFVNPFD